MDNLLVVVVVLPAEEDNVFVEVDNFVEVYNLFVEVDNLVVEVNGFLQEVGRVVVVADNLPAVAEVVFAEGSRLVVAVDNPVVPLATWCMVVV